MQMYTWLTELARCTEGLGVSFILLTLFSFFAPLTFILFTDEYDGGRVLGFRGVLTLNIP